MIITQATVEIASAHKRIMLLREEAAPQLHVEVAVLIECVMSLVHAAQALNDKQQDMQDEHAELKREFAQLQYQISKLKRERR